MRRNPEPLELLSTAEAAAILGISTARVRELISHGRIRATLVGRSLVVTGADLIAYTQAPKLRVGRPRKRP